MRFIFKNQLDYILRYIIGVSLLLITLLFIFAPDSPESFKKLGQPDYIRQILGWTEVASCVLFIFYKTSYFGAFGLLAVFAFAAYLHLRVGLRPYSLIGWTVGVLFILYCDNRRKNYR
jgi:DoxX-like family